MPEPQAQQPEYMDFDVADWLNEPSPVTKQSRLQDYLDFAPKKAYPQGQDLLKYIQRESQNDPKLAPVVQHLAGMSQDELENLATTTFTSAKRKAREAVEAEGGPGIFDALQRRTRSTGNKIADSLLQGGLDIAAGGPIKGLGTLGKLYRAGSAAMAATGYGPLDAYAGKDFTWDPASPVSAPTAANAVGILGNALRSRIPGLQATNKAALLSSGAEGFLGGGLGAIAEGDSDPTRIAAQGLIGGGLGAVTGGFSRVLGNKLSQTGAVKLRPDRLPLDIGQGEVLNAGFAKPLVTLRKNLLRKDATIRELSEENDRISETLSTAFENNENWLQMAKKSRRATMVNAVKKYEENLLRIAAEAPDEYLREQTKKTPAVLAQEATAMIENLFPSSKVAHRDSTSKLGADTLGKLFEMPNAPPSWRKAVKQSIINFFAKIEPGTDQSSGLKYRMESSPIEARAMVNKIFKDPEAFEKLAGVAEAHRLFSDVKGPVMAFRVGQRTPTGEYPQNRSFATQIGDVLHVMSLDNIAEAIMQKKGALPSFFTQWGEKVVDGKVKPGYIPQDMARELMVFINTFGKPVRRQDLYGAPDTIKIGNRVHTMQDPRKAEPPVDELIQKLTGKGKATAPAEDIHPTMPFRY